MGAVPSGTAPFLLYLREVRVYSRRMIDAMLKRIYEENPHDWPYGLSKSMFKSGSLWAVKHEGEPVGFVGWQETTDRGRKIGYYSIGILPEHRNKGYAKSAIRQMLSKQANTVDEVRAAVVSTNVPSLALNSSIVSMSKDAGVITPGEAKEIPSAAKHILMALGGAGIAGPGFDYAVSGQGKSPLDNLQEAMQDPSRVHRMGVNAGIGALAGMLGLHSPSAGIGTMLAVPTKDLIFKATEKLDKLDTDRINKALDKSVEPGSSWWESIPKPALYAALAGGAGAAGLAGLNAYQKYRANKAQEEAAAGGRVTITLPTKQPGDTETQINLPMDSIALSSALRGRLGRDTRRRLYEETRGRTKHRRAKNPERPTEAELESEELRKEEEELNKEASIRRIIALVKSSAAVPTPPMPGTNPAYAMQQQQQAMQQQPSRTQGNPDIQQAQQQAQQEVASAQQQAQQEMTQVQQDAQQQMAKMQQDMVVQQQQMGTELEKARTENEIMKLKAAEAEAKAKANEHYHKLKSDIDREKMKSEIAKAESAGAPAAEDQHASARAMIDHRLASIGKHIMSKKATGPAAPPAPAAAVPQAAQQQPAAPQTFLKPGALNDINTRGNVYGGQIYTPRAIHVSSGNQFIDQLMNVGRQYLATPDENFRPDYNESAVDWADASDIMAQPGLAKFYFRKFMNMTPSSVSYGQQ